MSWHPYKNEILTSSWDGSVGLWYYSHKESLDNKRTTKEKQNHDNIRRSLRLALKNQKAKQESDRKEPEEN